MLRTLALSAALLALPAAVATAQPSSADGITISVTTPRSGSNLFMESTATLSRRKAGPPVRWGIAMYRQYGARTVMVGQKRATVGPRTRRANLTLVVPCTRTRFQYKWYAVAAAVYGSGRSLRVVSPYSTVARCK